MKTSWIHHILSCLYPPAIYEQAISKYSYEEFRKICPASTFSDKNYQAVIPYKHPLGKALIYSVKFSNNTHATVICARLLAERIHELTEDSGEYIIIPLPSSKQRLREKGFNQCFKISKHLNSLLRENVRIQTNILYKRRHTSRQALSAKQDRLTNLKDCFVVYDPKIVFGKQIIVFDDVITTGATMEAALDCLRKAGAKTLGIAVAH